MLAKLYIVKQDRFIDPVSVLCQVLGQFFDKLTPVLERGESQGLPPGHAMCGLLQVRNGALDMGILPVPDLAIGGSFYCDMGPKADELMSYRYEIGRAHV